MCTEKPIPDQREERRKEKLKAGDETVVDDLVQDCGPRLKEHLGKNPSLIVHGKGIVSVTAHRVFQSREEFNRKQGMSTQEFFMKVASERVIPEWQMIIKLKAGDETVVEDIIEKYSLIFMGYLQRAYPNLLSYSDELISDIVYRIWGCRCRYDPNKSSLRFWFMYLGRKNAIPNLLRELGDVQYISNQQLQNEVEWSCAKKLSADEDSELSPIQRDIGDVWENGLTEKERAILVASLRNDQPNWALEFSKERGPCSITAESLDSLRSKHVPEEVLGKLEGLKGQKFNAREDLVKKLTDVFDEDQLDHYQNLILESAECNCSDEKPGKYRTRACRAGGKLISGLEQRGHNIQQKDDSKEKVDNSTTQNGGDDRIDEAE